MRAISLQIVCECGVPILLPPHLFNKHNPPAELEQFTHRYRANQLTVVILAKPESPQLSSNYLRKWKITVTVARVNATPQATPRSPPSPQTNTPHQ
jgi:hypothetical protein